MPRQRLVARGVIQVNKSMTFMTAVALGVLAAYAFPCYWGDCQDLP